MALYYALARISSPPGRSGWRSNALVWAPPLRGASVRCRYSPRTVGHEWCLVEIDYAGREADALALDSADSVVLGASTKGMADLGVAKRNSILSCLDGFKSSYEYLDQNKNLVTVPPLDPAEITGRRFSEIFARLKDHFQHAKPIAVPSDPPDHNTEYTDDFSTDVSGRWTETQGTGWTYNGTDDTYEITAHGALNATRYDGADTGSLDMESQATFKPTEEQTDFGPCARYRPSADTFYSIISEPNSDTWYWTKMIAGVIDVMGSDPQVHAANEWYTFRLATVTNGSQVDMSAWFASHGGSKPADPGWIGVDGSPDDTFSDTEADRIVDSDARIGGMFAYETVVADFFKTRALSNRAGGASLVPVFYRHRQMQGMS